MATVTIYQNGWQSIHLAGGGNTGGVTDWDINGTLFLMLLTSNYNPDASATGDSTRADIVSDEVSGTGYTLGGNQIPVANNGISETAQGDGIIIDGSTVTTTFSNADFSYQYAVLYETKGSSDSDYYLIGYADLGQTTASNQDVEITITNGEIATFTF